MSSVVWLPEPSRPGVPGVPASDPGPGKLCSLRPHLRPRRVLLAEATGWCPCPLNAVLPEAPPGHIPARPVPAHLSVNPVVSPPISLPSWQPGEHSGLVHPLLAPPPCLSQAQALPIRGPLSLNFSRFPPRLSVCPSACLSLTLTHRFPGTQPFPCWPWEEGQAPPLWQPEHRGLREAMSEFSPEPTTITRMGAPRSVPNLLIPHQ